MTQPNRHNRTAATLLVVSLATAGAGAFTPLPSDASPVRGDTPRAAPSTLTPNVQNGAVRSVTTVGSVVVLGGTFTKISSAGSSAILNRNRVAAFSSTTGHVSGFSPVFNGPVTSVESAHDGSSVFVGGDFTRVNGRLASRVVRLDLASGRVTSGFKAAHVNQAVNALVLRRNTLYLGGFFSRVGGKVHRGLAGLDPASGGVKHSVSVQFTGNHGASYGARGRVGLHDLALNRNGTRLVAVGNFLKANSFGRAQVAVLRVGSPTKVAGWKTKRFARRCSKTFASYMSEVDFSPTGAYFVIATTGGRGSTSSLCDSASRWETGRRGASIQPTWVDKTGWDTLSSVDVTRSAVYVGGHQRWLNNPFGRDDARPGAVPRPGIAALGTVNGLPLAWNPGRNPRGVGAGALLATRHGLYVGSDTNWIGDFRYQRKKIAYFPFAGGRSLPSERLGQLPGNVFQFSPQLPRRPDRVNKIRFTGTHTVSVSRANLAGTTTWSGMRGAVLIGKTLFYGWKNGKFYRRTLFRDHVTHSVPIDPYHDKRWATVPTGADNTTYDGRHPSFYAQIPSITGMFYWRGRLYYATGDSTALHWRSFSVDSRVVSPIQHTVRSPVNWHATLGLFRASNTVYFASRKTGALSSIRFSNGRLVGKVTRLPGARHRGFTWASRGLVVYPGG